MGMAVGRILGEWTGGFGGRRGREYGDGSWEDSGRADREYSGEEWEGSMGMADGMILEEQTGSIQGKSGRGSMGMADGRILEEQTGRIRGGGRRVSRRKNNQPLWVRQPGRDVRRGSSYHDQVTVVDQGKRLRVLTPN